MPAKLAPAGDPQTQGSEADVVGQRTGYVMFTYTYAYGIRAANQVLQGRLSLLTGS